jgi:hypothetical protein
MERVHQLFTESPRVGENDAFWIRYWHHIASAKTTLEMKIAAYCELRDRGLAHINELPLMVLYEMMLADRQFVAELDLDDGRLHCYRLFSMWINDDVAALVRYSQELTDNKTFLWNIKKSHDSPKRAIRQVLMVIQPPRCIRFLLQDQAFREVVMQERMSPLVQRLVEELVQPTDYLDRGMLLWYGQSVKLIGMCVKDEELVAAWCRMFTSGTPVSCGFMSVPFARKLHALATPNQRALIKTYLLGMLRDTTADDGHFELAWLLGLFDLLLQNRFLKNDVSSFPAFTFAMIVAMCDGYLKISQPGTMPPQSRFFNLVMRLPMDLQALISLRLWGHTSTVIRTTSFDRALLVII